MNDSLYAVVAVDVSTRQKMTMLARAAGAADQELSGLDDHPLFHTYHYAIPQELSEQLLPGQLLWVPFGTEQRQGLLLGFDDTAPVAHVRELAAVVQAEPFLQPYQIELARWMSERYLAPLWDTLLLMLPSGVLQNTERILRRTGRIVAVPLTRDARVALSWVEGQEGESTHKQVVEVLGSEKRARGAVGDLLRQGLLRDSVIAKPPGLRPRMERFVALVPPMSDMDERFANLGRASKQADVLEYLARCGGAATMSDLLVGIGAKESVVDALVSKRLVELDPGSYLQRLQPEPPPKLSKAQQVALDWLDDWPADEVAPLRAALSAGIRMATVQGLLSKGFARIVEAEPEQVRLLVPAYRAKAVLDEMRGSELYRAVLDFLVKCQNEMPVSTIYESTGAEWRHIEALRTHGLVQVESREVLRNPLAERVIPPTEPPLFTPEQAAVWSALERVIGSEQNGSTPGRVFLLHGVTGSGKTEIYLRAVAETLARGKQAIVLVPEISLTPQTIARFGSRFGELIALQHSQLSAGERYDEWRRLRDGRAQVAIGSRSAIFAPLRDVGVIVIDEEHEWTYKQGYLPGYRFPQYQTRDVAEKLAELTGATVILGSATPAMESYRRTENGRYRLLEMGQRVMAQLSPVQIVDMRQELRVGNTSIFSRALQQALAKTLDARQQAILFLNRRGAHSFVMCRDCGWVRECEHCDVALTAHRGLPYLLCHQCNTTAPVPLFCNQCLSPRVKHFGVGTQQVEEVARRLFPDATILRWDRDTARGKGAHERLLASFAAGQADILIGTQMIAKGLDLPLVTLVGIISADTALHLPDFRSSERTFQLLTQVAGRAGRSTLGGQVVLQTYSPLHYAIQSASRHNFHEFYGHELAFRREHAYPPFAPLVKLVYAAPSPRQAEEQAHMMAERLRTRCAQLGVPGTEVIGPAPAFFGKLRGRYRWQVLIRGAHARQLARATPAGIGWEVDVDPVSVL